MTSSGLRLELLEYAKSEVRVLLDLDEDAVDLFLALVRLVGHVLKRDAVLLSMAIARQQHDGPCVGGLEGERKVEEDERVRIPALHNEAPKVDCSPSEQEDRMNAHEPPRA